MTTPAAHCPFCNAETHPAPGTRSGHRVECPRCGETFPYTGPDVAGVAPSAGPSRADATPAANRRVALLVVAGMAVTAAVALGFALATQSWRTGPHGDGEEPIAPVVLVPPAELPALGHLPPGCDVVTGVHVAELVNTPEGKKLLAPPRPALLDTLLTQLTASTGLTLDEIDHAVLGLALQDRLLPRLTLVVQTRRTLDPDKFRQSLGADRSLPRGKHTVYPFRWQDGKVPGVLRFLPDRTFVMGLAAEDLDDIPEQPTAPSAALSPAIEAVLRERVGPASPVWVVGHLPGWERTVLRLWLGSLPKPEGELLAKVRTVGLWLQVSDRPVLNAAAECADEDAARALDSRLTAWLEDPRQGAALVGKDRTGWLRELAASLKHVQQATWVTAQATLPPATP